MVVTQDKKNEKYNFFVLIMLLHILYLHQENV